jgi:hypothetical protein
MEVQDGAEGLRRRVDEAVRELIEGEHGFVIVRGLVPPDVCAACRAAVGPTLFGRLFGKLLGTTARMYDLASRAPAAFGQLLDDEVLEAVVVGVCGEAAKCGSFHAHSALPTSQQGETPSDGRFVDSSCLAQKLHIDYPYGMTHARFLQGSNPPQDAPRTCQVLWMLDDFTTLNGATVVVPGSHLKPRSPDPTEGSMDMAHAVATHERITGRVGDALIYTGQLWHAVPQNRTKQRRTAVLAQFLPFYFQSMEGHARSMPRATRHRLPSRAARLLSDRVWPAGLWNWIQSPKHALIGRMVDITTSWSGALGAMLGLLAVSAILAHLQASRRDWALIAAACGASYLAGTFSAISYGDIEAHF